jgi:HEAT repeat protein
MGMVKKDVQDLIRDLESSDYQVREAARIALVSAGMDAIPALEEAISNDNPSLRWQAAKVLSQFQDPQIIPILLKTVMENPYTGVRWAASEGVIKIGSPALVPLLRKLIEHSDSAWLREGAHHILHSLRDQNIESDAIEIAIHALESVEATVEVPIAANKALQTIKAQRLI